MREIVDEPTHRALYESYLERDDATALVALLEGRVVGFMDLEWRQRLGFSSRQAWIPDLIVTARARGRRIGSALLARAEELARGRGCWGMSLESASWRTGSHAFYVREGWTETGKSFTKSLSDHQWPPLPPDA